MGADLIVQIRRPSYERLLSVLDETGLQVAKRKVKKQLASGYNIISIPDKESSHEADFIIQTRPKLERRAGSVLGIKTYYQTPEALLLAKLRMIKAPLPRDRSLKDKEDIRAIIRNTRVDMRKIVHGAKRETTFAISRETLHKPVRVKAGRSRWGKKAFPTRAKPLSATRSHFGTIRAACPSPSKTR